MGGEFLYFVQTETLGGAPPEFLTKDLLHVFGDAPGGCCRCATSNGPEGNGFVIRRGEGSVQPHYKPDEQTWLRMPDRMIAKPEYGIWVGMYNVDKPAPEDLRRPEMFDGHVVKMADGQDWLIPIARGADGGTCFPIKMVMNQNGDWGGDAIDARYDGLFKRACEFWDEFRGLLVGQGSGEMTLAETLDLVTDALAVNYFIGPVEASLLGMLEFRDVKVSSDIEEIWGNSGSTFRAMLALVDWPGFVESVKKNDPGPQAADSGILPNSDTKPGGLEESPSTALPSASLRD